MNWLNERGIEFQELAIRETPPSLPELKAMLTSREGQITRLFNTSGMDYRAQGLKDTLPTLSEKEALTLLAGHGNLVKRPFIIDEQTGIFLLGFKKDEWDQVFG